MFATTLVAMAMLSSMVTLAGNDNKTIKFNKFNAYGSEFVSFVAGPLMLCDRVCYSVDLIGAERKEVSLDYRVRTNSKIIKQGTLNESKRYSVKGTNVNGGYGNPYAESFMFFNGSTYRAVAYD